jgi:hypothetical protein
MQFYFKELWMLVLRRDFGSSISFQPYKWDYNTYTHGDITRKLPGSYLYLKQVKMSCFHFIFSLSSSTKSKNRRVEQTLPSGEGWYQWEKVGDRERR